MRRGYEKEHAVLCPHKSGTSYYCTYEGNFMFHYSIVPTLYFYTVMLSKLYYSSNVLVLVSSSCMVLDTRTQYSVIIPESGISKKCMFVLY